MKRIGIFICRCGSVIGNAIDSNYVYQRLMEDPCVKGVFFHDFLCRPSGMDFIRKALARDVFDRVVIGGCSTRLYEENLRDNIQSCHLDRTMLEMINLREQCANVHNDIGRSTSKTVSLLRGASARVATLTPVATGKARVVKKALVIGGGIAGVQCSLDIAAAGYPVCLVEKGPSIGGIMAQLDKTIPTLDCSICIEGPKLSDAGRNKNITVIPNAEVKHVTGRAGDFTIRVEVKPTYVDPEKCNGCGACIDVCPVFQPNKYDVDLKPIKAIYSPFAQAVPLKYVINKDICTECGLCMKACGLSAINLKDGPKTTDLNVGAIVNATGAEVFDPKLKPQYHYGEYEGVVTNMEFERIICASGPTGGELLLRDKRHPRRVAFIQCVGSRDEKVEMEDCSFYCCAVSLKQARLIKEHAPETEVYIFYTDLRAFGKGWEELYTRVREDGVVFIRSRPSEIIENREKGLIIPYEDSLTGIRRQLEADMAVLALGMRPSEPAIKLAKMLRIPTRPPGFIEEAHPKTRPLETIVDGVFIAGTCHGPRDISESVVEGSGAAGLVVSLFKKDGIELPASVATVDAKKCSGCLRCIDACEYGAIVADDSKVKVLEHICKGCGSCTATCFQEAIVIKNWSSDQLLPQVNAILEV